MDRIYGVAGLIASAVIMFYGARFIKKTLDEPPEAMADIVPEEIARLPLYDPVRLRYIEGDSKNSSATKFCCGCFLLIIGLVIAALMIFILTQL